MLNHNSAYTQLVYQHLGYTSSHPTSTQYTEFYTAEPHCAHTYAHTYVHTAKRCLDPPRATMFRGQRREGVVLFTHAPHTATSTSAITPTKNICDASSACQILRYSCILNIRCPMHKHASPPGGSSTLAVKLCGRSGVRSHQSSEYARTGAPSTLAVKLCGGSGASSTLAPKLRARSHRSSEYACSKTLLS